MFQFDALKAIVAHNADLDHHDLPGPARLAEYIENIAIVIRMLMSSEHYHNVLHAYRRELPRSHANGRAANSMYDDDREKGEPLPDLTIIERITQPDDTLDIDGNVDQHFFVEDNLVLWSETVGSLEKKLAKPLGGEDNAAFDKKRSEYQLTLHLYHAYLLIDDLKTLHLHLLTLLVSLQHVKQDTSEEPYLLLSSLTDVYLSMLETLRDHVAPLAQSTKAELRLFKNSLRPIDKMLSLFSAYQKILSGKEAPSLDANDKFSLFISVFLPPYLRETTLPEIIDDSFVYIEEAPMKKLQKQISENGFHVLSLKECAFLFRMVHVFGGAFKGASSLPINDEIINAVELLYARGLADTTKILFFTGHALKASMLIRQLYDSFDNSDQWFIKRHFLGPALICAHNYSRNPSYALCLEVTAVLKRISQEAPDTMTNNTRLLLTTLEGSEAVAANPTKLLSLEDHERADLIEVLGKNAKLHNLSFHRAIIKFLNEKSIEPVAHTTKVALGELIEGLASQCSPEHQSKLRIGGTTHDSPRL